MLSRVNRSAYRDRVAQRASVIAMRWARPALDRVEDQLRSTVSDWSPKTPKRLPTSWHSCTSVLGQPNPAVATGAIFCGIHDFKAAGLARRFRRPTLDRSKHGGIYVEVRNRRVRRCRTLSTEVANRWTAPHRIGGPPRFDMRERSTRPRPPGSRRAGGTHPWPSSHSMMRPETSTCTCLPTAAHICFRSRIKRTPVTPQCSQTRLAWSTRGFLCSSDDAEMADHCQGEARQNGSAEHALFCGVLLHPPPRLLHHRMRTNARMNNDDTARWGRQAGANETLSSQRLRRNNVLPPSTDSRGRSTHTRVAMARDVGLRARLPGLRAR